MKARALVMSVMWAMALWGCTQAASTTSGYPVGSRGMVLVDQLPDDGTVATTVSGVPGNYLFVTSTDTNELKVVQNYVLGVNEKGTWVRAPNPLEVLTIPVLDGPSTLFADEGLSTEGRRVTGRFVYAIRNGGAELSVVDATPAGLRQVTSAPLVMPAPITAAAAWLGFSLTQLPDSTQVYVATFDGSTGTIYSLTLATDLARRSTVATAKPVRLLDVGAESIQALAMVPPLAGRAVDGQPFCAGTSACLVVGTRSVKGAQGRTLMVDPDTLRTVALAFPGPVRALEVPAGEKEAGRRIHGLLDNGKCDSTSCGGVMIIDTLSGTAAGGFPVLVDFSGQPMLPIQKAGVYAGSLAVAGAPAVTQGNQAPLGIFVGAEIMDGGAPDYSRGVYQGFTELGAFSLADGEVEIYDGVSGSVIDNDPQRPSVIDATLVTPLKLSDGGYSFTKEDGGTNTSIIVVTPDVALPLADDRSGTLPLSESTVTYDGLSAPFVITLADGYLQSQTLSLVNQGPIPGLEGLATSASDGDQVRFSSGLEARLAIDDRVAFSAGLADGGIEVCGETRITGLSAGSAAVAAVPAECAQRSRYTVYAQGARPLVLTASVEGFIARAAEGETVTYTRRYAFRPSRFDGVRPAMVMKIGSMTSGPGAYWLFSINGHFSPYRMAFNFASSTSTLASCLTALPMTVLLAEVPYNSTTVSYPWYLFAQFPDSNSVATSRLFYARGRALTLSDYAWCYR